MMWGILIFLIIVAAAAYDQFIRKPKHKKVDPWAAINKMSEEEYADYVADHLSNKRILNDFVLTRAAFPIEANTIVPREGYLMSNGVVDKKAVYTFVAAVSAEKIWGLFVDFFERLGDACIIEIDSFMDSESVTRFRSAEMGACYAIDVLIPFHDLIVNNCLFKIIVTSADKKFSMTLTTTKHILIYCEVWEPITELFEIYNIKGVQELRFYTEKEYVYVYEWTGANAIHELLERINIIETVNHSREEYAG